MKVLVILEGDGMCQTVVLAGIKENIDIVEEEDSYQYQFSFLYGYRNEDGSCHSIFPPVVLWICLCVSFFFPTPLSLPNNIRSIHFIQLRLRIHNFTSWCFSYRILMRRANISHEIHLLFREEESILLVVWHLRWNYVLGICFICRISVIMDMHVDSQIYRKLTCHG